MAKLSRDDVYRLGQLARIRLTDEEAEHYATEISTILDYVDMLMKADIKGLKPTNQVNGLSNVWRADEVIAYGYNPVDLLKNVPCTRDRYIQVRRMI